MSDYGDQFAMAAGLDAQHAEPALRIMGRSRAQPDRPALRRSVPYRIGRSVRLRLRGEPPGRNGPQVMVSGFHPETVRPRSGISFFCRHQRATANQNLPRTLCHHTIRRGLVDFIGVSGFAMHLVANDLLRDLGKIGSQCSTEPGRIPEAAPVQRSFQVPGQRWSADAMRR